MTTQALPRQGWKLPKLSRRPKYDPILVNGKKIRFRGVQQLLWKTAIGVACVAAVAALYYIWLELRWSIGPIHFWLKAWWDGLVPQPWWDPVRHDIRNVYEGVVAFIGIGSFTAAWKPAAEKKQVSAFGVAWRVAFVLVAGLALAAGGAWLLNVGFPAAWHWAIGHYVIATPHAATSWMPAWLSTFLSQFPWQPLLLGFVIGRVIHPVFRPAGETINGFFVDRAVAQSRKTGKVQLWARYPLAPPTTRERYSFMMDMNTPVGEYGTLSVILINVLAVIGVFLALYGEYIKVWFAKHGVPGNMF